MSVLGRLIVLVMLIGICREGHAQEKQIYWPSQFDQYPEVTMERSAESDNFAVFWGSRSGLDPTQAPKGLRFDPAGILEQLEAAYDTYIDDLGFLDDDRGNLSLYKIIVVMNNTWKNAPWTGWAFGSQYDDTIGAMWVHPNATNDPSFVLAHELTHSLQCMVYIDHPGHGFIDYEPHGFFWETHAQFMAEHHYPQMLEAVDYVRFFNTAHYHWSSTRHHYGNTLFLRKIEDTYGVEVINRMWRESIAGKEHPLTTFKRIMNVSQSELNDIFGDYAMRNVHFDYEFGDEMRHTVENELDRHLIGRRFTALLPMEDQPDCWKVPDYMAPGDYGYNTVQLEPDPDALCVDLTFHGQPNEPAGGSSFRFGFVAMNEGSPRYSELFAVDGGEELAVSFDLQPGDDGLYLVVLGAPIEHHDYMWEPGWPKIHRYPWAIRIEGAFPFVNNHRGIDGAPHPNGGGFVASTASVDPGAWVGPDAQVLGNASVRDDARIEGQATVTRSAVIRGNARVRDAAFVGWSQVSGNAILEESTKQFGTVAGTYRGGGDAEGHNNCSSGHYRQTAHPNNGRGSCDGLEDHPANTDVNPTHPDHVFSGGFGPDFNGDGCVNGPDLALLLVAWGEVDPRYDLDRNGAVGSSDLGLLFAAWQDCP